MIKRSAASALKELTKGFPIVALTGPRQSGKTTLAKLLFSKKKYISFESLEQRAFAQEDPKGFLLSIPDGAIIDEAQHCPDLFSELQVQADQNPRMGQYVLTGSQQFGLLSKISQSLAGRVGLIQLLPLSLEEISEADIPTPPLNEILWQGFYPALYDRSLTPTQWYANYVKTYLERDVRQVAEIKNLAVFRRFLQMCAARNGQILNTVELGTDCGVSHVTIRHWLSILEASYIVFFLQPHHKNFGKRLTKRPKLYFYDSGLVSYLLQIESSNHLSIHSSRGALFESFVISEFLKQRFNKGLDSNLTYWRDNTGNEIDLIVEKGEQLIPFEIKSGHTLDTHWFSGLKRWQELAKKTAGSLHLVYGGDENRRQSDVIVSSWRSLATPAKNLASAS